MKNLISVIDFFCGGGGMSYGLAKSGLQVLAGIDCDKDCQETYEYNNPSSQFFLEDINKLEPNFLEEKLSIRRDDGNLIFVGCSPCQYWTLLNTNKTKSKKTKNLLMEFLRFIDYFLPGFVVVENVPGILQNKREKILIYFINTLKKIGYNISTGIINTNDFGVPQNRMRFLLLASRSKTPIELPKPVTLKSAVVRDFIGERNGFRKIKPGIPDNLDPLHKCANLDEINKKRLKLTPKNGGDRSAWRNIPQLQIPAYVGKNNCFKDVYSRMYWDRPAPTITTKFLYISNGRFAHPEEDRGISLREGAVLQTFPKSYEFFGTAQNNIAKLIGNAVPPKLAEAIGKTIKEFKNGNQ